MSLSPLCAEDVPCHTCTYGSICYQTAQDTTWYTLSLLLNIITKHFSWPLSSVYDGSQFHLIFFPNCNENFHCCASDSKVPVYRCKQYICLLLIIVTNCSPLIALQLLYIYTFLFMFVLAKLVNSVYKQTPSLYCHSFFIQLTRYCLWNRSTNSLEKNGQIAKSNGMPSLILEPMLITMLRLRVFSLDWSCLIISNIIFPGDIFVQIVLTLISHLCIHITKFWTCNVVFFSVRV
jgi:hypothetical protein